MKFVGQILCGLFLVATVAQAQTSTDTISLPEDSAATLTTSAPEVLSTPAISARGLRVSLFLPQLKMKTNRDLNGENSVDVSSIDRTFGVALGYANLPIRRLGWIASAALMEMTELDEDRNESGTNLGRLDANLAYAMNQYFYLKAGGNVSSYIQDETRNAFYPWPGYQAALGVQLSPGVGIEAGYLLMSQRGRNDNGDTNLTQSGLDFSITGTF